MLYKATSFDATVKFQSAFNTSAMQELVSISLMLAKNGVSLKMAKRSYCQQKVARTAYYAGAKRGTCRANVLVSMLINHFME